MPRGRGAMLAAMTGHETPCVNPWSEIGGRGGVGSEVGLAVKRFALCPAGSLR